jgi:hypothetical protein
MIKKSRPWFIAIALVIPFILTCSVDYNPFANFSNAQVRLLPEKSSIHDGDAINFFSTETLTVFTTNREIIKSFTIHADSNLYWTDTTISAPGPEMEYRFLLSFVDTGIKTISISTHRTNGDVSLQSPALSIHVLSPLKQKNISGSLGIPCTLSTPGVTDKVYYIWSFGAFQGRELTFTKQFALNNPEYIRNVEPGAEKSGYLWVTDSAGRYQSPKSGFTYIFIDSIGPTITCISKGVRGKDLDTVVTGEENLEFTVTILDESDNNVVSVELVGGAFDWASSDRIVFKKVFSGMRAFPGSQPRLVTVKATDKQGNLSSRTFALYFDAAGPTIAPIRIRLINPQSALVSTRLDHIQLLLGVDNATLDSVEVSAFANTQLVNPVRNITAITDTCSWNVPLLLGDNAISRGRRVTIRRDDPRGTA